MKLVCPKCECEFRPEKNGVGVIETASFGPYKLWRADLWECQGCQSQVIAGFSGNGIDPIAEHFESDFQRELEHIKTGKAGFFYDNEIVKKKEDAE